MLFSNSVIGHETVNGSLTGGRAGRQVKTQTQLLRHTEFNPLLCAEPSSTVKPLKATSMRIPSTFTEPDTDIKEPAHG